MIFAGVLTQETAIAGIDFNTLALLTGMMIIVGIAEKSGMFQYVAVWAVHRTRANPRSLLFTLGLITARFFRLAGQRYHRSADCAGNFPNHRKT